MGCRKITLLTLPAMIAGHIDALTARLKPIPTKTNSQGFVQLGVAAYSGGMNNTWWDRDLAVAGRVMVKGEDGKIVQRLVNLAEPSMWTATFVQDHYLRKV